jgi:hypothetical protein
MTKPKTVKKMPAVNHRRHVGNTWSDNQNLIGTTARTTAPTTATIMEMTFNILIPPRTKA